MVAPEDNLRVEDIRRQESFLDRPAVRWVTGLGGIVWATMTGIANTSKAYYQSVKWEEPLDYARSLRKAEKAAIIEKYIPNATPEEIGAMESKVTRSLSGLATLIKQATGLVSTQQKRQMQHELDAVDKQFAQVVDAVYEMSNIPTKGWTAPFKATAVKFARLERHERSTVIFSTITSVMIPLMGLALLTVGARAKKNAEWQQDVNEHQERNLIALRKQIEAQDRSAGRAIRS